MARPHQVWRTIVLSILSLLCAFPGVRAADGEGEFAINLFTDLAPILALFGEKFATQFVSETLDWVDHVIFAMVPLGIVTAITAAIRVQGPAVARQFIGLARENRASAEIEIMSSTSHEVCELFNGKGIIRAMGRANIKQILVFPVQYNDEERKSNEETAEITAFLLKEKKAKEVQRSSCGIHTIATACGYHPITTLGAEVTRDKTATELLMRGSEYHSLSYKKMESMLQKLARQKRKPRPKKRQPEKVCNASDEEAIRSEDPDSEDSADPDSKDEIALALRGLGPPNLQLNHSRPFDAKETNKHRSFIVVILIIGVLLQLALIAIAGVTAYHRKTKSAVSYEYTRYGFPCYAAGSACLCLGMTICAFVIGQSTVEWSWECAVEDDRPQHGNRPSHVGTDGKNHNTMRLFWVQKQQSVNDQSFGAYAILEGSRKTIVTSSRAPDKDSNQKRLSAGDEMALWHRAKEYRWEGLTMFGVLLAVAGFITQFIGLRGLPYPVSITQLVAILIMAFLRARARSGMSRRFLSFETSAKYELDFLAIQLAFNRSFRESDGKSDGDILGFPSEKAPRHGWRVVTADVEKSDKFLFRSFDLLRDKPSPPTELNTEGTNDENGDTETKEVKVKVGELGGAPQDGNKDGTREEFSGTSQQLLRVRQRLGHISTWQSPASNAALALSRSIVYFLDEFFPKPEDSKFTYTTYDTVYLNLAMPVTRGAPSSESDSQQESIIIRFRWQDKKGWEADQGELDAVLSLWMAHVEEAYPPGSQTAATGADGSGVKIAGWSDPEGSSPIYRYRRILGDNYGGGVLKRDLNRWVEGFNEQMLSETCRGRPGKNQVKTDSKLVIGFNSKKKTPSNDSQASTETSSNELAVEGCMSLPLILAQHLFTLFIWSISEHLAHDCLGQGLPQVDQDVEVAWRQKFVPEMFETTWTAPTLIHRGLSKVANQIERTGLGNAMEIFLCMLPPLSSADLLPNEAILRIMPQKGPDLGWISVAECYGKLLKRQFDVENEEHFCYEAVVAAIDFLLMALEPYGDGVISPAQDLERALSSISTTLTEDFHSILESLMPFYELQGRMAAFAAALKNTLWSWAKAGPPDYTAFKRKLRLSDGHLVALQELRRGVDQAPQGNTDTGLKVRDIADDAMKHDIFGWTPIHYASLVKDPDAFRKYFGAIDGTSLRTREIYKLRDKLGRSPYHHVARMGRHEALRKLLSYADDEKAVVLSCGFDGMTVLHLSVHKKGQQCFQSIISKLQREPATMRDAWGREPLHWAAIRADKDICNELLARRGGAEPEQSDDRGRTPVEYMLMKQSLTQAEMSEILNKILNRQVDGFTYTYRDGRNLLHLAAEYGTLDAVKQLKESIGKELDKYLCAPDNRGRVPLHAAIMAGKSENAFYLLEQGKGMANVKDCEERSSIVMACSMGLVDVVSKLLGPDHAPVDMAMVEGEREDSLLHFAVDDPPGGVAFSDVLKANRVELIRTLVLDKGAKLGATNKDRQTPLILACRRGFTDAVKKILSFGAELSASDDQREEFEKMLRCRDEEFEESALDYACELGHESIVQELLSFSAAREIHHTKYNNFTAIHFAIYFGGSDESTKRKNIVVRLCDVMPDFLLEKDPDLIPYEFATTSGKLEVRDEILKHPKMGSGPKVEYLKKWVQNPSHDNINSVFDVLCSFPLGDFGLLLLLREDIAKLGEPRLVAEWTKLALKSIAETPDHRTMAAPAAAGEATRSRDDAGNVAHGGTSGAPVAIPFSFAVRGWAEAVDATQKGSPQESTGTETPRARAAEIIVTQLLAIEQSHQNGPVSVEDKLSERDAEDGWSIRDWARRCGLDKEIEREIESRHVESSLRLYHDIDGTPGKQGNHDTKAMTPSKWQGTPFAKSNEEGVMKIQITEKNRISYDTNSGRLFIRADHCVPPSPKDDEFSFQVIVNKLPGGGTVMIGFCGEFIPKDPQYPGRFYGSWGFEDQGRIEVEDTWDECRSDKDGDAAFGTGDRIVCTVKPRAGETFYKKNAEKEPYRPHGTDATPRLKADRFRYGKLYPCVCIDASEVGTDVELYIGGPESGEGRKSKK